MPAATHTNPEPGARPDAGPRTDLDGASPSHAFRWLVSRVGTRLAAAAWWTVMVLFDLYVVSLWVRLAQAPTPANALLTAGLTAIIGVPIVHEWSHARRMARMLVHGT